MNLIDPSELSNAIGIQGPQSAGSLQVPLILAILANLRPAIEGSMNVESLDYQTNVDTFLVDKSSQSPLNRLSNARFYRNAPLENMQKLRLTNALLDLTMPITVASPSGIVDPTLYVVDARLGMITLQESVAGRYTVTYASGLKTLDTVAGDGVMALYQDVPGWLKSVVVSQFMLWARTHLLQMRVPENVSLSAITETLHNAIGSKLYSNFMRPRVDCFWAESHRVVA